MLDALPVELVQLVAVRLPAPSIAALALVCRHTAACLSERAFVCDVGAMHGVPAGLMAACDDPRALHSLIASYMHAPRFDDGARVSAALALSANRHAVVSFGGFWRTAMSHKAFACRLHAPPRVFCFRVERVYANDLYFRVGITTSAAFKESAQPVGSDDPECVCCVSALRAHMRSEWSACADVPQRALSGGVEVIPASMRGGCGYVAALVARSASQPGAATVVMLVLHSPSAEDHARATVRLCFARRLPLGDDESYSTVVSLAGARMACMCVRPPSELIARASELIARADTTSALSPYIDDMLGVVVDAPQLYAPADADFRAFASLEC